MIGDLLRRNGVFDVVVEDGYHGGASCLSQVDECWNHLTLRKEEHLSKEKMQPPHAEWPSDA